MTQEAAQQRFWESFGIPAYPNTAVPKNPQLPYLTYQQMSGYWNEEVSPTVQLWYYSESEAEPNEKAREIGNAIGFGVTISCDDGIIHIQRGEPWRVAANAQEDSALKLRQLNVRMQFFVTR